MAEKKLKEVTDSENQSQVIKSQVIKSQVIKSIPKYSRLQRKRDERGA